MINVAKLNLSFADALSRKEMTPTSGQIVVDAQPVNVFPSFIGIVNTLPDPLLVYAEVDSCSAWPLESARPDIELPWNPEGARQSPPSRL